MKAFGHTFRILLRVLTLAYTNDGKTGVVLYVDNKRYCDDLFVKCLRILDAYGVRGIVIKRYNNTLIMPNGKTLRITTVDNMEEKRRGIDWTLYDELSDHYIE